MDHGRVERTLDQDVDEARRTLERFAQAGIDYDDVVAVLEREGVEKFVGLVQGAARRGRLQAGAAGRGLVPSHSGHSSDVKAPGGRCARPE